MQVLEILLKGLLAGLGLSLGLGTVFFALIQTSIKSGYKNGFFIAIGVILSDIIFITFALVGTSFFDNVDLKNLWIQLPAVSLLMVLGIYTIFHSSKPIERSDTHVPVSFGKALYYASKGFLLNFLNPANFFAWAAISAYTTGTMGYSLNKNIIFFSASLVAIFLMECGLSFGAHKIKKKLTHGFVVWVNRISGSIYILVAIFLIVDILM